jgi:hypothetical protein
VRRALSAALLLVAAVLAPGLAQPAEAGVVSGACTTSKGVTVVVNYGSLGGGVQVHCDTGATSSTTGLTALKSGFTTQGTYHDGPGFVCRINGKPTPAQDPCIKTPPGTAYWSYWHATNGGTWTYSTLGAMSRKVTVGGFEGWSFGDGSARPTSSNPSRPVPTVQPTVKLGPAAATTTTKSSTRHSSSTSPSRTSTAKPTASRAGPTTATATSAGATPVGISTTDTVAGGARPGAPPDGGGSAWPLVGAGSAIALIIAGAVVVSLRRRGVGGF